MSRKVLAGVVAVVVLALAVWLVPTAFGSSGTTSSTTSTITTAASASPAPHTGCSHAPATTPQ